MPIFIYPECNGELVSKNTENYKKVLTNINNKSIINVTDYINVIRYI
jgi:hypothetical protein